MASWQFAALVHPNAEGTTASVVAVTARTPPHWRPVGAENGRDLRIGGDRSNTRATRVRERTGAALLPSEIGAAREHLNGDQFTQVSPTDTATRKKLNDPDAVRGKSSPCFSTRKYRTSA